MQYTCTYESICILCLCVTCIWKPFSASFRELSTSMTGPYLSPPFFSSQWRSWAEMELSSWMQARWVDLLSLMSSVCCWVSLALGFNCLFNLYIGIVLLPPPPAASCLTVCSGSLYIPLSMLTLWPLRPLRTVCSCLQVLMLWVGRNCAQNFLSQVLGVQNYASIPQKMVSFLYY